MTRPSSSPMQWSSTLDGARAARVPRDGLRALAGLRHRSDVRVLADQGEACWVSWEPGDPSDRDAVVEALLPVAGVVFYRSDAGQWFRGGRRLPEFKDGPPEGIEDLGTPLHRAIVPEPSRASGDPPRVVDPRNRLRLSLVRSDRPGPATALLVSIQELLGWAESAPSARFEGLRAARSGDRVLVVGNGRRLPPVVGLGRASGRRVLVPIGFRTEPDLPESKLAEAIGLRGEDRALIDPDGRVEVIPDRALGALSRGSVRRLAGISDRVEHPEGQEGEP